ncbi:hypothetical protein [Yersinia enterocolitica]
MADVIRRRYPETKIIIDADNDWHELGEYDEKANLSKILASFPLKKPPFPFLAR